MVCLPNVTLPSAMPKGQRGRPYQCRLHHVSGAKWCTDQILVFGCDCRHVSRILRRKNIIALGLAACQKDFTVAALVNQLMEACDEKRLLKMQRDLATVKLPIFDELG